jgi:hypothetical protein
VSSLTSATDLDELIIRHQMKGVMINVWFEIKGDRIAPEEIIIGPV